MSEAHKIVQSFARNNASHVCWSCSGAVTLSLICPHCARLQPVDPMQNAFAYFGLDENYSIDLEVLEKRYLDRQRQIHPDRFVATSEQEKAFAAAHAVFVNEAYLILKDAYRRAKHLLALNENPNRADAVSVDMAFLEYTIERQEALAEAKDVDTLQHLLEAAVAEINNLENELSLHFAVKDFHSVQGALNHLKYATQFLKSA